MNDLESMKADIRNHQEKLVKAYQEYLLCDNQSDDPSLPHFYPYEFSKQIRQWQWPLCGKVVSSDLPEVVNCLNAWNNSLKYWSSWMAIINRYKVSDPEFSSHLGFEFLYSRVFFCMMQPASMLDRLLDLATLTAHVFNLCTVEGYQDWLPISDPKSAKKCNKNGDQIPVFLSKKESFEQIDIIFPKKDCFVRLKKELLCLNDASYVEKTFNWRNRSAHEIPQHYDLGHINMWTRNIEHVYKHTLNSEEKTLELIKNTSQYAPSYTFGYTDSMNLQQSFKDNLEQFFIARKVVFYIEEVLFQLSIIKNFSHKIQPSMEQERIF